MRLPERIEGRRLHLRRWRPEDASVLAAAVARNVEHLRPWMPWIEDEPLDAGARLRLIEGWGERWAAGGDAVYGVFDPSGVGDAHRVVGGCGLHHRSGPDTLEIGYWVDRDHLRLGVGTDVARMLTTTALAVEGIIAVEIHHDPTNVASGAIPRRLGYTFLGTTEQGRSAWRMEPSTWRGGVGNEC